MLRLLGAAYWPPEAIGHPDRRRQDRSVLSFVIYNNALVNILTDLKKQEHLDFH